MSPPLATGGVGLGNLPRRREGAAALRIIIGRREGQGRRGARQGASFVQGFCMLRPFDPFDLPHACETAEVAALLAELTPRQRRTLRDYVWRVELGQLGVSDWLRAGDCPVCERSWYAGGGRARYLHCAAFQEALRRYLKSASSWQLAEEQRAIARAHATLVRSAPGAAARLAEQAEADLSQVLTTYEVWTSEPRDTDRVLNHRYVANPVVESAVIREYYVRRVGVDVAKLTDPCVARHVRKLVDSPRNGLTIEFYDAQRAAEAVLDRADAATANKAQGDDGQAADWWDAAAEVADGPA